MRCTQNCIEQTLRKSARPSKPPNYPENTKIEWQDKILEIFLFLPSDPSKSTRYTHRSPRSQNMGRAKTTNFLKYPKRCQRGRLGFQKDRARTSQIAVPSSSELRWALGAGPRPRGVLWIKGESEAASQGCTEYCLLFFTWAPERGGGHRNDRFWSIFCEIRLLENVNRTVLEISENQELQVPSIRLDFRFWPSYPISN
jgi:hypothetical protein